MSGVAGVFRLGGDPITGVERTVTRAMIDTMAHRGSTVGVFEQANLSLAWRTRPALGESVAETWPIQSRDGRFLLVHDGRIDNRDDLRRIVGEPASATDGRLVVEAFAKRGAAILPELCGDFVFVLWDTRDRRLLLARDLLGVRSIYWAEHGGYLWWASELQAMLQPAWYRPRICEGHLAEYLAARPTSLRETAFDGIERLPQAHVLIACDSRVSVAPYYAPPVPDQEHLSAGEHAERLNAALRAAMAPHPGVGDAVGFQVSGGLDSSSVIGLARDLSPSSSLRAYSLVFPGLASADESRFIAAMTSHVGARSSLVDPRGASGAEYLAQIARHRDWPDAENGEPLQAPLYRMAHGDGVRTLFTGFGGDNWLSLPHFSLASQLQRGRWRRAAELVRWRRRELRTSWPALASMAILPNLSPRLKALGRPVADRMRHPRWIPAAFARRINLADRLRANSAMASSGETPSARESLMSFWCGERAFYLDRIARSAEWWGMELRHPFLDRRVVEATIALPDDQRWRNGRAKEVLRRAMGGVLPPIIRDRLDKAHFSDMMPAAIEMLEPDRWLRSSALADAGFIDAAMLREMLAAVRRWNHGGPPMYEVRDPIWHAVGAEAWMRQEGFGR